MRVWSTCVRWWRGHTGVTYQKCDLRRVQNHLFSPVKKGFGHLERGPYLLAPSKLDSLLRGAIVNRTHDIHKNLYNTLLLLSIFGPIYYGPP